MAKKKPSTSKPSQQLVVNLPITEIIYDETINPRVKLSEEAVDEYEEYFRKGMVPPNLVVFREKKKGKEINRLVHGFHRFKGAEAAGVDKLPCEIHEGTRNDAIVYACSCNITNAVRRTNADKRRAVELLLDVQPNWTDHRIAEAAGVSHPFVAEVRREVVTVTTSRREGKGGKVYTVEQKPQEITGDESATAPPEMAVSELTQNAPNSAPPAPPVEPETMLSAPIISLEQMLEEESDFDAEERAAIASPPVPSTASVPAASPAPEQTQGAQNVHRDQLGRILPTYLVDAFRKRGACKVTSAEIGRTLANLRLLNKDEECGGFLVRRPYLETDLNRVSEFVRTRLAPYCVCPACDGDGDTGECPTCQGRGYLPRAAYHALPKPLREKADSYKPWDAWEPDDADAAAYVASTVNDIREHAAGGRDAHGVLVPKHLRDVFSVDFLHEISADLERFAKVLSDAKGWLHWLKPEVHPLIAQVQRLVQDSIPYTICVACEGDHARSKTCSVCMTSGYHPQWSEDAGHNAKEKVVAKKKKGGAA